MVKLSHSALGYFGTRLAQTRRSLHSLADPSLVSGEPKASHMAGIKEWRNQNPRRRQPWRFAAPCTDSAPARSLSRRHWRPSSAKRANTVRIATQISSSRMEVHLAILVARASPREGCGAVRRALLCCGCHRAGARVATCNSRRVKKLVPKSSSLLRRENSLFFENNSLLWLQKFPVRLRREFVCKPLNSLADGTPKSQRFGRIPRNSLYFSLLGKGIWRGDRFDPGCLHHHALAAHWRFPGLFANSAEVARCPGLTGAPETAHLTRRQDRDSDPRGGQAGAAQAGATRRLLPDA